VTAPLRGTDVKRLNRDWRRRTGYRVALLLDDLQTPFNVGAIVRTAAALRVERLYLTGATVAPTDPKARKLSLGTERFLDWVRADDGPAAVAAARADGFRLVAVELAAGARPLHEADLAGDVCLVLGHEERGVSRAVLAGCDEVAFVPQLGRVGSLNVAHAAAIALYEVRRREWAGGGPDPV
jgi:tRNA (guanosine-2'-O-)-methyltransferase